MIRPTFPVPSVHTGDTVAIYLSRHFPVYERDGVQVIPRYYALSVLCDQTACSKADSMVESSR